MNPGVGFVHGGLASFRIDRAFSRQYLCMRSESNRNHSSENHTMQSMKSITRRVVASSLFVVVAGGLFAVATIPGAQAEPAKAASSDAGVWMIVTHELVDYKHWKPVHDRSASIKRNFGWKKCAVFAVDGNQNHVMVMEQFASLDRARAYANSTELRDEMAAGGVSSNPEIHFVNNLTGEVSQ